MFAWLLFLPAALLAAFILLFWTVGERGKFLPSTWRLFREARFRPQALHAYIYGRWTVRYVRKLFSLPLPPQVSEAERRFAAHYHGKVLTHDHARAVVELDRDVPLQEIDQIVPYPIARSIVLTAPPDIVAYECACRHARGKHCEPTRVCMVVGKPFTDFVLDHNPGCAQRLTREEALALLDAEHARGHVHSAWFKDAMMNRFYAICNCCKCCCGGVAAMRRGSPMMVSSGYVAEIDAQLCASCGNCVEACPFNALSHSDDGPTVRDWDRCMGCGACEVKCSTGAVSLVRDERKGVPLDVRALASRPA